MLTSRCSRLLLFASIVSLLASTSAAQLSPAGSLLVFAEYDTRIGHKTLITVTNTNETQGTRVKFNYVDAAGCTETDRAVSLTAGDTFTIDALVHVLSPQRGYLYVNAGKGSGSVQRPMSFNHLVGTATHFDGTAALTYTLNPISFTSPVAEGSLTDLDLDTILDLDGNEYQQSPDVLLFPRFVGQSATVDSELVLIGLSGGAAFTTVVDFLVYNDNEVPFTAQFSFQCWARASLSSLNSVFDDAFLKVSGDDPSENFLNGNETGWFTVDGDFASSIFSFIDDAAVLGVLLEPSYQGLAQPPFQSGVQDNGDLLPTGPNGDPQ